MKTLVLYYSFGGTTRRLAEAIARSVGADLAEIRSAVPLETREDVSRLIEARKKFEILPLEKDPADYDLIFLGSPVWAFQLAAPLKSFLIQKKIEKKKVALFCTYRLFPGLALWNLSRALRGNKILAKTAFKSDSTEQAAEIWAKETFSKA
ncbi:MAG TPA: hypothetical protein DD435_15490 [Cyanobacteria bacterium UBA8530]|nr:hypothetical protein [Cyanobacteria bacterium UBA8530]